MNRDVATQTSRSPMWIALAVAVFGILGMLLVDHGPWNKPHLQTAQVDYASTGAAAQTSSIPATVPASRSGE